MAFQTTINYQYAFGLPGDIIFDGPNRTDDLTVNSSGAANVIGYAYTKNYQTGVASVGGTITSGTVFAGILVNSKVYASYGGSTGPLSPSFAIPDNSQGEFMTMGTIAAYLTTAANIGDLIAYNTTTGALSAYAPGGSPAGGSATVPNASVRDYPQSAAGVTAIQLTN